MISMNTRKVKAHNLERIKTALKNKSSGTKLNIAGETGLSVATCGNLLNELLESGEVIEIDPAESTGGRPSRRFVYNADYQHVAGFYIRKEGSIKSIHTVTANLLGEVIEENRTDYDRIGIEELESTVEGLAEKDSKISSLSCGVPGVVRDGKIGYCDFHQLKNFDTARFFETNYDVKYVVENDVNTSAFGFYSRKSYPENQNLVYIYFPSKGCPGAGLIINGRLFYGYKHFAGEIGNLPLGIGLEKQGKIQNNPELFAEYVSKIIGSITCILNPKRIILSGLFFNDWITESINVKLQKLDFKQYLPEIILERDFHESYQHGLIALALEKLSEKTKMNEKEQLGGE